jgi:tetratricopeptide (TPR) repeat protein
MRGGYTLQGSGGWPETKLANLVIIDSTLTRRMTTEREVNPEKSFVSSYLPWVVGAGALVIYLLTLNHWVSLNSLPFMAKTSGWTWQPELSGPLLWLVTYPFRWLPASIIPIALNLFTAICAALSLALLARSVALLPHDRSLEQRQKEKSPFSTLSIPAAWVPPVLAVLVCGLQFSFWENATAASADMFDLLIFAYAVRCLLEYRISDRESWLLRTSLAFGLGMTNNWVMIAFFPVLLVALVWIKGLSFFNLNFLSRMFLYGSIGLLLYFVLPLVSALSDISSVSFWPALKQNLASQKFVLQSFYRFCNYNRQEGLLLALLSVVPLFSIGIRWPSYFGDSSKLGIALATFIFHVIHALFLAILLWAAFNPTFTPYSKGYGSFLTYYYLGALTIGYCCGYFLLVFNGKSDRPRYVPFFVRLINSAVTGIIWLLLLLTPLALISRNLPRIRATNGPMLQNYAALMAQALPPQRAVLLSDDPRRALLMEAYSAKSGKDKDYLILDTGSLLWPDYHRFLKKNHPLLWDSNPPKSIVQQAEPMLLVQLISRLAQTNSVYYLHPSFGYYFEFFCPEPHGLVYKLNSYATNALFAPRPGKDLIAENEAFWTKANEQVLQPLVAIVTPSNPGRGPGLWDNLVRKAHLSYDPIHDAAILAPLYSRALDYWGVEMQKSGQLTGAASHFQRALDLNPDNLVAQINLECNKNLQAGRKSAVLVSKAMEDEIGKYRKWDDIIGDNGPFDEPNFCYEQGRVFVSNNLYRQGAAQFDRAATLAPNNLLAHLWLGQLYVMSGRPAEAIKLLEQIHERPELIEAQKTNRTQMLLVESSAHLAKGDLPGAEAAVRASLKRFPGDADVLATATQVYMKYGCYSNALGTIEQHLLISPTNITALVNKGCACIQIGAFEQAIPPLTQVLTLEPTNHTAMLNRAISYLRANQLEAAQRDYQVLQQLFPTSHQIYYGLGEIAWRKKDTNSAVKNYDLYLANTQTNTAEARIVTARLKELKSGSL